MTDDLLARQLVNQAQEISRLRYDLDQLANESAQISADLLARIEESGTTSSAAVPAAWYWRDAGPQATDRFGRSSARVFLMAPQPLTPWPRESRPAGSEHPEGVRVSFVHPGTIATAASPRVRDIDGADLEGRNKTRLARPDKMMGVLVYVASQKSSSCMPRAQTCDSSR